MEKIFGGKQDASCHRNTNLPGRRGCFIRHARPQTFFDGSEQLPWQVWLGQEDNSFFGRYFVLEVLRGITAGADDRQIRIAGLQCAGERAATHPVGHDNIRKEKLNTDRAIVPDFERLAAIRSFKNAITTGFEGQTGHFPDYRLVLDKKDHFTAAAA